MLDGVDNLHFPEKNVDMTEGSSKGPRFGCMFF